MRTEWRKDPRGATPLGAFSAVIERFDGSVTAADYAAALQSVDLYEPIAVYLRLSAPREFGAAAASAAGEGADAAYLQALINEIRYVGRFLGGRGRPVSVTFLGAGGPRFAVEDLAGLVEAIELELGLTDDARLSVELDPGRLREEDFWRLAALGFRRVSLRIAPSTDEDAPGDARGQGSEGLENQIAAMRRAGLWDIGCHILYDLPGCSPKAFIDTVARAAGLGPDRIALIPVDAFRGRAGRAAAPASSFAAGLDPQANPLTRADEIIIAEGYRRIGFAKYAAADNALCSAGLDGRLKRHIYGYTDDGASTFLGFGAGAVSSLSNLYIQNLCDEADYVAAVRGRRLPVAGGLICRAREQAYFEALSTLFCTFHIDLGAVETALDADARARLEQALAPFFEAGVIEREGAAIKVNPGGEALADALAATVFSSLCSEKAHISAP